MLSSKMINNEVTFFWRKKVPIITVWVLKYPFPTQQKLCIQNRNLYIHVQAITTTKKKTGGNLRIFKVHGPLGDRSRDMIKSLVTGVFKPEKSLESHWLSLQQNGSQWWSNGSQLFVRAIFCESHFLSPKIFRGYAAKKKWLRRNFTAQFLDPSGHNCI